MDKIMQISGNLATNVTAQDSNAVTIKGEDDNETDDSLRFIFVPLAVLMTILVLSALVYLMARNRQRLTHIYCKHRSKSVPSFTFDEDSDSPLEQGDIDDDPTECLIRGKLQIDNNYETYQNTYVKQHNVSTNRDLYT